LNRVFCFVSVAFTVLLVAASVFGQSRSLNGPTSTESTAVNPVPPASEPKPAASGETGRFAIGVKLSLLGAGFEVAAPVTRRTNMRAGFNMFSYSRNFQKDGANYDGQVALKSMEAHYDIFPWAARFHISPGILTFIGSPVRANASVPAGQSFSLGGTDYYSDSMVPVTGTGRINFNRVAPMVTLGWGNLVPRKHFSVPFELGVAFQGSPKSTLHLMGNVCEAPGFNCRSVDSDPTVQSQIVAEQAKINNSMSSFKVYPIISVGFGYTF
jgi:hypothetical protein